MAEVETFHSLKSKLAKRRLAPIYVIHGEETYYIDELVKMIDALVAPEDRDFNMTTFYAPEIKPADVVEACSRYPMMADFQVVLVKEAQQADAQFLNGLAAYAAKPSGATVLAIVGRGKALRGAEFIKAAKASGGVVYEAKKLREKEIGLTIKAFISEKGLNIEEKALMMLQDYVGSDLSRIYNEVDKLTVVLGPNAMITPEAVERNIGYSKTFNPFELKEALAARNAAKAFQIVEYFSRNPKANPVQPVLSNIFNLFSDVLAAFYSPDKSDNGLLKLFNMKWAVQLTDIKNAIDRKSVV